MEFTSFQPLWWLALIPALAAGLWLSLVDRPAALKYASFGLRVLGVILLILALCRPFRSDESEDVHVVFLVDVSESVALDSAIDSLARVDDAM